MSKGSGSQILMSKARAKHYSLAILEVLTTIESSPLIRQYENAKSCCHTLRQNGQKIKSRYCNTRACHICNRIRTGKMWNGYVKPLMELGELRHITLTQPNCRYIDLRDEMKKMCKSFSNIVRHFREKKGIELSGVRKLESTYNFIENTFHPHLHILANANDEIAESIIFEWMKRFPDAVRQAQHYSIVDENALHEIFKYVTKFIVKDSQTNEFVLYAEALNEILISMNRLRTFQPFGKVKRINENIEKYDERIFENLQNTDDEIIWRWPSYFLNESDWINFETHERLTGYKPVGMQMKVERFKGMY